MRSRIRTRANSRPNLLNRSMNSHRGIVIIIIIIISSSSRTFSIRLSMIICIRCGDKRAGAISCVEEMRGGASLVERDQHVAAAPHKRYAVGLRRRIDDIAHENALPSCFHRCVRGPMQDPRVVELLIRAAHATHD